MIKVMICDDQVLLCESLSYILNNDDDVEVIDTATNGEELLEKLEQLRPDVVLMDIEMPIMSGVTATKHIKEHYQDIKVIILTTFEQEDNIMDALVVGADGYVVKNISHDELVLTVKLINKGLCVIDNSVKDIMIKRFSGLTSFRSSYVDILSEQDIEIIMLVATGKSNKEIACEMGYTEGTIKNKISKILEKLELEDRMQIAIFAIENGIV